MSIAARKSSQLSLKVGNPMFCDLFMFSIPEIRGGVKLLGFNFSVVEKLIPTFQIAVR